jgi:carboxypeptidase C (cathepsin A)
VYGEDGVADDMLDFLQEFFEAHPDMADRPFFVTGESYAVGAAGPGVGGAGPLGAAAGWLC